jgi:hypothetical protein
MNVGAPAPSDDSAVAGAPAYASTEDAALIALVKGVSDLLWQWEGSDELYGEFAERVVNYVLNGEARRPQIAPRETDPYQKVQSSR